MARSSLNSIWYLGTVLMIIIILSLMASQFDSFEDRAIPLDIYQTWHTKDLQPKMAECVEKLKMANPEFQHHLFDEIECREFINSNFDDSVIEAYDSIIPKAYKADLWRYCVLYIKGGVYLDIKYYNVDGFKLIELTDREYFVRDVDESGRGIYNAFMICKPGNSVLKQCIDAIVENTRSDFYGESALAPTGPILMKRFFTSEEIDQLELTIGEQNGCPDKTCIYYKDRAILSMYKEYRDEQNQTNEPKYYDLWGKREMYEKHTLP